MHGARVLCYGIKIGVGGIINYEDVVHVSRTEGYVFGIQEEFYMGLF